MKSGTRWLPFVLLTSSALLIQAFSRQPNQQLRHSLDQIPAVLAGYRGAPIDVRAEELSVSKTSSYLAREYRTTTAQTTSGRFELHICYYAAHGSEKWTYDARLCHLNPMWVTLNAGLDSIPTDVGFIPVQRYLIQRGADRAIALVWHQGRGRIAADKYKIRFGRALDAVLKRRSEEAIVRLLIPIQPRTDSASLALGGRIAGELVPMLERALPASRGLLAAEGREKLAGPSTGLGNVR